MGMDNRYKWEVYSDKHRGAIMKATDNDNNKNGHITIDSPTNFVFRNNCEFLLNPSVPCDNVMYSKVGITPQWSSGYIQMKGKSSSVLLSSRIPVINGFTYRVTVSGQKMTGSSSSYGTFYCGVHSLDANYNGIYKDKAKTYNYGTANALRPSGEFKYSGTYNGFNSTSGSNLNKFDPGAKYFDIILIANYNGTQTSSKLETRIFGVHVTLDHD